MSMQMLQIRSVKQYFREFIQENANDLSSPVKRAQIKLQILDAFRREIFEQIAFGLKLDPDTMDLDVISELDSVRNILHNSFRKWKRLCVLCTEAGLGNWLALEDLKQVLDEESAEDGHANGGDFDGDEIQAVRAGETT